MTSLWWIRRDIRLADNPALAAALRHGPVIPVFVLDPRLLSVTPLIRQNFMFNGLRSLHEDLARLGSRLIIRRGSAEEVLAEVLAQSGAQAVYAEEDFTPFAHTRDARVAALLPLHLIHGQTTLHPLLLHKPDGAAYTVFTPFSRTWKSLLPSDSGPLPAPAFLPSVPDLDTLELPPAPEHRLFPAGEREAKRRLECFTSRQVYAYADERDRMDLDGTSALSPYLRFGMLSMRQAVSAALAAIHGADSAAAARSAETWLNELIWREFYISILYHFPRVSRGAFKPSLAGIPWRDSPEDFEAWCSGRTGMPIVDAGMRQLAATGWMHNRARMITASYLVKDLLLNWQLGEGWFMQHLLDGDPAANNGGWQWTAGTGTDAAPYFRIFNPLLQGRKFDPHGGYIREWVPELSRLPDEAIHAPWEKGLHVPGYPARPLVEHSLARERTLRAYRESKNKLEYEA